MASRNRYPSAVSDAEWAILEPLLPPRATRGRPPTVERREVVNAICSVLRTGCPWRYLPQEFPNWNTVSWYFARWLADGTWEQLHDALRRQIRVQQGRDPDPSAASG